MALDVNGHDGALGVLAILFAIVVALVVFIAWYDARDVRPCPACFHRAHRGRFCLADRIGLEGERLASVGTCYCDGRTDLEVVR